MFTFLGVLAMIGSEQNGHLMVASGASAGPPCMLHNAESVPIGKGAPQRPQKFAIFYLQHDRHTVDFNDLDRNPGCTIRESAGSHDFGPLDWNRNLRSVLDC